MSTIITPQVVGRIAELIRLHLTDQEVAHAATTLSDVLDHFATIQKIATDTVPAADDVTGLDNVTRDDTAQSAALCSADELLAAAPTIQGRHLKVQATLEQ